MKKWDKSHLAAVAIVSAALAVAVTVIILNLIGPEKQIEQRIVHRYAVADPQFRRELGILLGPSILAGNRVANLENGEEIFPAMLAAVRAARHSITFETYIYWSGEIGREFAEALAERARAGVKVHVLIDWLGSQKMEAALLELLRQAGVEVKQYHPLHWYHLTRMNNRTHRKLLVIDGRIGFTGGVGIADVWRGDAQDRDHWRDSHYLLEGPAVAQMQAAFMDNWIKTSGEVLQGTWYFPQLQSVGDAPAQVFTSSPTGGANSMMLMYLMAIASSVHSIDLSASYFVPDAMTRRVLVDALERGVRIRIVLPGKHIDTEVVRSASRASWGALLEAGAEIHEYQPTMFHCKTMIVDRLLASVGSTNFDNRSFQLNDEANLNIYDRQFAEKVSAVFERDLQRSRRMTLQMWQQRPLHEKFVEHVAALFSSQL